MDEIADESSGKATKPSTAIPGAGAGGSTSTGAGPNKRDFFGRALPTLASVDDEEDDSATATVTGRINNMTTTKTKTRTRMIHAVEEERRKREARVWVSYHEGFSNAVRKPVTLREIMSGL